MRKLNLIMIFLLFSGCFRLSRVNGEVFSKDKAGTTSAQFLKLGVGARPIAMGEAFVGVADDVNAIFWNPAGLVQLEQKEISGMYALWFEDIFFSWLAYAQKGLGGTVGGAVNFLSAGVFDKYDNEGNKLDETYPAYDLALTLSYARIIKSIAFGINIKLINSRIEKESAVALARDLGLLKEFSKLKIGLVVQNLGSGLNFRKKEDPLPTNIKTGIVYKLFEDRLLLAFDANFPVDYTPNAHLGAEYNWEIGPVCISPRLGYKTTTIGDLDALSGVSTGIGFSLRNIVIDYAWVPYWELGNTHRISVSAKF